MTDNDNDNDKHVLVSTHEWTRERVYLLCIHTKKDSDYAILKQVPTHSNMKCPQLSPTMIEIIL